MMQSIRRSCDMFQVPIGPSYILSVASGQLWIFNSLQLLTDYFLNRFWWNCVLTIVFHLLFIFIPFAYAFHLDLERKENLLKTSRWSTHVGYTLNAFCWLDILFNFFTGYQLKNGNHIVLNQKLIIR